MGKDLFGDLMTDIEERYLKYNDEATLKEFADFLEKEIEHLNSASYDNDWAKRVFYIYEKLENDKKLLNAVPNSIELKGMYFIAEAIIEVEDEQKIEDEKHQYILDCAKDFDNILLELNKAISPDEEWCQAVDCLDYIMESIEKETLDYCNHLDLIKELKLHRKLMDEVIAKDKEVLTFSLDKEWDKHYAKLVLAFINTISTRAKKYMKNSALVDKLQEKAQSILNED